jgi:2C-methyl-D-erythritol 2,4-cyclodiphosphate synthase
VLPGGRVQLVGVSFRKEKGSDGHLASHLLMDALNGAMDAAVVISNDSDLELPISEVRKRIPIGTVSPHGPVHGALQSNL